MMWFIMQIFRDIFLGKDRHLVSQEKILGKVKEEDLAQIDLVEEDDQVLETTQNQGSVVLQIKFTHQTLFDKIDQLSQI